MPEFKIVLNTSAPHSNNHGDCLPDDPHYRVKFWQGQLVGKDMVLLPFDSAGELVPDDGKTSPWQALNADSKPCTHYPLWNKPMRDLLERKLKRQEKLTAKAIPSEDEDEDVSPIADDVDFARWLRGQAAYDWPDLQVAGKKRHSTVWTSKKQMVIDLVLDHHVVPEDQVCKDLAGYLKALQPETA